MNFGPDLDSARLEMLAANIATRIDGTVEYLDERVVASIELGTLYRNRNIVVNLSWRSASRTPIRFRSRFFPIEAP